ncbi:hypothetical protein WR25_02143 [Diploscapter pachys]|uniref:Homeobox domain-containing protein n=1 Tax=Diploscapter pachys TaxID=2018661 RepID=A0A2A2K500_9BILA|nr:hypothetical protein WR25_02143 [Diploscapter pachys]
MKRVKHEVAPMENSQNTQPENMLERERQATEHDEQLQTHSAQLIQSAAGLSGLSMKAHNHVVAPFSSAPMMAAGQNDAWRPQLFNFIYPDSDKMLHATSFDGIQPGFYGRFPMPAPDSVAAYHMKQDDVQKWPADAAIYPFAFPSTATPQQTEVYPPSDPYPSTSTTMDYKLNSGTAPYYPNSLIDTSYPGNMAPLGSYAQFSWKSTPTSTISQDIKPSKLHLPKVPYQVGPGSNNVRVRTADKYRMVYTDYQRLELEKEFLTNQFITADRKSILSLQLNLTERQIKIWMQNRRAKDRREKKKVNPNPSAPIQ